MKKLKHGTTGLAFPGTLLAVACLLLAACASLGSYSEPPRVSLVSLHPEDMTLFEQRYALRLRIQNPNDAAIPLEGLSYSVRINGKDFAYGVSKQSVNIPAFGEALIDVSATSSTLDIIRQVQSVSGNPPDEFEYHLEGKLSLGSSALKLPFDYQGSVRLTPDTETRP